MPLHIDQIGTDDVHEFPVHLTVEQWTAIVRVMEDHAASLVKWDDDTRSFYEEIVRRLQEGPFATA